MKNAITLHYDNSAKLDNTKETRNRKKMKHIRKHHIIREAIADEIIDIVKIASENNLANSFTKTLLARNYEKHIKSMEIQNMTHLLQLVNRRLLDL
ncbi:hypothetical protein J1N35_007454, partial [Gossypium stocksii]